MWKWYNSKITEILQEGPNTRRFFLQVDSEDIIDFEAGQFVTMDLPIHEKRLKRWRSYSIANGPDGTNVLEFCIVKLDGGAGTEYLFETAAVGTEIRFKGPSGGFVLPKQLDHQMILVCTGTGVAPFRSMLQKIAKDKIEHKGIHLIFGTRTKDNILYRDELNALAMEIPNCTYSIVLSREENWTGWKGHVHRVYEKLYKVPQADRKFYLCGWSQMVDSAVEKIILELGYDKRQVVYELYG